VGTGDDLSTTDKVSFVYILSATLTVLTNGDGTVTPNDNNALLQIGASYSLKAEAAKGFGFVNWTDGGDDVLTNGVTLKFIMASNLTIIANFKDITPPTLKIVAPTVNEKWTNSLFTVTGTASDNVGVVDVYYSFNDSDWAPANTANDWSNWTEQVTLTPGTNTIAAYAMDAAGNLSTTDTVKFISPANPPAGMALIPAGSFTMGDTLDGEADAIPTNVFVSGFYMDTNLVSYIQWVVVYAYATSHGYGFDNAGSGKGPNYPVETLDWYDCVKWCNARSQQAGLTPVYYTDAGLTQVYTNGDVDITNANVNWTANGYRLPTEAEWEKAARGGLRGQRFPWGDTISESQANYLGCTNCDNYDLGPSGLNPIGLIGGSPDTSPVGSFAPNRYRLFDMAGNADEWCWDWYAPTPYPTGSPYLGGANPTGPTSGTYRVLRGGDWGVSAQLERCANREYFSADLLNSANYDFYGFRCVKGH
jgi:formylglycine-generating enzyme required for sulfatase activity